MAHPSNTVPIALSCGREGTLTPRWFVQGTEYAPAQATFQPLVNGEEAFGAVYDAITNAKHSIDIICWGFQPSMYFKRGRPHGMPIGELLAQKGALGIKVKLLCWQDSLHVTQWGENMAPGTNLKTAMESGLHSLSGMARNLGLQRSADWLSSKIAEPEKQFQREFDQAWYWRAQLSNVTDGRPLWPDPQAFANLEFATRDFYLDSRIEIAYRTWLHGEDRTRSAGTKAKSGAAMGLIVPTHHQKMVLIDYDDPALAVGFVMGHNTLDEYWDTNKHSCMRLHPAMGRNGWHPRQDISSRVTGPVLQHLNANFCQAWDKATGQNLTAIRAAAGDRLTLRRNGDTPVMAQVLRTQSQEGEDSNKRRGTRDIEKLYLQAVNNATRFIYIENQYFRWQPLADKIKALVKNYAAWGRATPLYLFVVTNASDDGIGPGTVNTYRMLNALGRADTIPAVAQGERADELLQQRRELEQQLAWEHAPARPGFAIDPDSAYARKQNQAHTAYQARTQELRRKIERVDQDIKNNNDGIVPSVDIDGLKVHVCSLVSPDTTPGEPWLFTYVHAKLMIVDDVFMTLGSANLNTRSMEADSELNICHERMDVTQPLRRKLWEIHTGGVENGAADDPAKAFEGWGNIIKENSDRQTSKIQAPLAPLVEFHYVSKKRSGMD